LPNVIVCKDFLIRKQQAHLNLILAFMKLLQ